MPETKQASKTNFLICVVLVAVTFATYARVATFAFLNYDDPAHLTHNPHVRAGLTADGVKWAFTTFSVANWFPVTWLSHMLCYQIFGAHAGLHHLVNVLIHALASVALFGFLWCATGSRWPSAFVAFAFALHPLHVESVAWVTERKDVLCALFWFLALRSWVVDAERPGFRRYLDTSIWFTVGLMSKPMIVTLPVTLLLVDFWPLRRSLTKGLFIEKWPFFALSAGSAAVTFLAQKAGGAVQSLGQYTAGMRLENAAITVWIYISKTLWPAGLAMAYAWPQRFPLWQALAAALAIAGVSFAAVRLARRFPWFAFGWFWFLVTLLPVIGLIQVGPQARADRYMYVPMVGLLVIIAWGAANLLNARPRLRVPAAVAAGMACLAMAALSAAQTNYWQSAEILFRHSLAVDPANYLAFSYLGTQLSANPETQPEALACYQQSVALNPRPATGHNNLANMYYLMGRTDEAASEYEVALRADPESAMAHDGLGKIRARNGRQAEALTEFETALRLDPDNEEARMDAARAYLALGRFPEAIRLLEAALRTTPGNVTARNLLGATLIRIPGRTEDGIDQLERALALYPEFAEAQNNLGIALEQTGRPLPAVEHFEEAVRIKPGFADAQHNLGVALLRVPGREAEALQHLETAYRLAPDPALRRLLDELEAKRR